jgi:hypothetical protein
VRAAQAAGAGAVLIPNDVTRPEEISDAPAVFDRLEDVVDALLGKQAISA